MLILWWAVPCETYSRARRWDGGPPPLRDDSDPETPAAWLRPQDVEKVLIANELTRITIEGICLAHDAGAFNVVENPRTLSYFFAEASEC